MTPAEPFAAVVSYGDSAINYTLRFWVPAAEYWNAFFTVNENIKAEFDKAGVEMTYPHLNVHVDK
jgi:small conductance mechanosensitive channel